MIKQYDFKIQNSYTNVSKVGYLPKKTQSPKTHLNERAINQSLYSLALYNRPNINFKSRVISDFPLNSAKNEIKELINKFEESPHLFKRLGNGKCSEVFVLNPNLLVIKKPLEYLKLKGLNVDFDHEAKMLNLVPNTFKNSQHFETRVRTDKGNYYLVSTFVKGESIDINSNPLNREKMKSTLNSLFELDKAEIYHMDLSNNNILYDNNHNANIIDYQWAQKFKYLPTDDNSSLNGQNGIYFPFGIIPSNVHHYESSGFASYLFKHFQNNDKTKTRTFLKDFIQSKSQYHDDRYNYFKQLAQNEGVYLKKSSEGVIDHNKPIYTGLKLEHALSKVYQNPNEDVLDIELQRIEFLRADRKAYNYIDANTIAPSNVFNAIPYKINAMLSAKHFLKELSQYEKQYENDKYMSRYIKYNTEITKNYYNKFGQWFNGTLNYLDDLTTNNADKHISIEANRLYSFDKFKTFDSLLSADKQKKFTSVYYIKYNPLVHKSVDELKSHSVSLANMNILKNYTFRDSASDQSKNVHHEVMNLKLAVDELNSMISDKKTVDAYCTAMYIKKLVNTLNLIVGSVAPNYETSIDKCRAATSDIQSELQRKLYVDLLNSGNPNNISKEDFNLRLIPQYSE